MFVCAIFQQAGDRLIQQMPKTTLRMQAGKLARERESKVVNCFISRIYACSSGFAFYCGKISLDRCLFTFQDWAGAKINL